MTGSTYTVLVHCSNCAFHGTVAIQKGTSVSQTNCSNCGCSSLDLQPKATWKTETKKVTVELDKKFDKLGELFDSLGKSLDDLFK